MLITKCENHTIGSHPKDKQPSQCGDPAFAECEACHKKLCAGHFHVHAQHAHPAKAAVQVTPAAEPTPAAQVPVVTKPEAK